MGDAGAMASHGLCEDGSPMPVAEHRFVALEPGDGHEALEAMGELKLEDVARCV